MDRISKLPPGIIETILCLVPIQEAARTSILSKEWRYHWIKIPKLAFIEDSFQVSTDDGDEGQLFDQLSQRKVMTKRLKIFSAIFQVLLTHEGPIHEFTLSVEDLECSFDVDHILCHFSKKNTVKKLTLDFMRGCRCSLDLCIFPVHLLTDLYLISCNTSYDHQTILNGFGSLTTLYLQNLWTSKETLLHMLSTCPLLKTLDIKDIIIGVFGDSNDSTLNLFECLPVIENLSICFGIFECFAQDVVPTALVHLKKLCIEEISFIHKDGLPILFQLIRSSPKLEKLKLEILDDEWVEDDERKESVTLEDYSDIWLEHLDELEIKNCFYKKTELDFVKLILAKSPVLKKVKIYLYNKVAKDEELEIYRILSGSPHVTLMVEFIIEVVGGSCTNDSRCVM